MICLDNHIGLKYCNGPEPDSGLYVNQMPGITLSRIDKSSEKDNQNFIGAWKDIKTRAWMILEKDVRRQLRLKYKLKAVNSNSHVSGELDELSVVPMDAKYRGVVIKLGGGSNFLAIGISKVAIWLTAPIASLTFRVFDEEGFEIGSVVKADLTVGKNVVHFGKKYLTPHVFIAVDASAVDLYTSQLTKAGQNSCCGHIQYDYDCSATIYGGQTADNISALPIEADNLFGFEVDFSVMCDYSSIICRNKTEFTDVWLYLLCAETLLESVNATSLSYFNTIDRDNAIASRDYYLNEYNLALKESISAIRISEDECCIECDPIIKRAWSLP